MVRLVALTVGTSVKYSLIETRQKNCANNTQVTYRSFPFVPTSALFEYNSCGQLHLNYCFPKACKSKSKSYSHVSFSLPVVLLKNGFGAVHWLTVTFSTRYAETSNSLHWDLMHYSLGPKDRLKSEKNRNTMSGVKVCTFSYIIC